MTTQSKLLIVDDEPVGRQLLEAIFLSDNYQIDFAENGLKTLHYLETNTPDLVLMDVMMPEMDGFEVCKRMRSNETLKSIPIILITALDDRDSRKRGLEAGANDYISKPFDRIEIEAKVKNLLQLGITEVISIKPLADKAGKEEDDEISYLTNLILEAQRPLKQQLKQSLGDYFHITGDPEYSAKNFFWLTECKRKIFILYIENQSEQVQYKLMNIMMSSFLNRTIQSEQFKDAPDLLKQLNNFLSEKIILSDATSFKNLEVNISLSVIDKNSGQMHFSGFNQDILLYTDADFKQIILNRIATFPEIGNQFNSISYNYLPDSTIYLYNRKLAELFKKHQYYENNCRLLLLLLSGKRPNNMNEQEIMFRGLFENTFKTTGITNDIELIGIKI
ncbi:MAG: response regulator [Bacteroidales bacterium]